MAKINNLRVISGQMARENVCVCVLCCYRIVGGNSYVWSSFLHRIDIYKGKPQYSVIPVYVGMSMKVIHAHTHTHTHNGILLLGH